MNSVRRSRIWSRTSRRKITSRFDQRMRRSRHRLRVRAISSMRSESPCALSAPARRAASVARIRLARPGRRIALPDRAGQTVASSSSGLALGLEPPLVDDRDPRAELLDLVHRVRREDDRLAQVAQLEDLLEDHPGHQDVEPRGRLVEDQDRGIVDDRPRDRDLLLHAGGHLRAQHVAEVVHLEPVEDRSPSARASRSRRQCRRAGRSTRPAPRRSSGRRSRCWPTCSRCSPARPGGR